MFPADEKLIIGCGPLSVFLTDALVDALQDKDRDECTYRIVEVMRKLGITADDLNRAARRYEFERAVDAQEAAEWVKAAKQEPKKAVKAKKAFALMMT